MTSYLVIVCGYSGTKTLKDTQLPRSSQGSEKIVEPEGDSVTNYSWGPRNDPQPKVCYQEKK